MANLNGCLVGALYGLYGSGRAHLGASRALGSAETALVAHLRLHEALEAGGGAEHLVRTFGHTQLTGGAVLSEMPQTLCAGWHQRSAAGGDSFIFYHGKAAVHLLFLLSHQGGASGQGAANEKSTLALVNGGSGLGGFRGFVGRGQPIDQGCLLAFGEACAAANTAAVVNLVILKVKALRLAVFGAESAIDAFVLAEVNLQQ